MTTKTKQKTKENKKENKKENNESLKALAMGFVGNIFERISDNVSTHVHEWTRQVKRRIAGSVVMVLGATYLLTGLSTYAESVLGKNMPGFGYIFIGVASLLGGYLVSRK